MIEKRNRFPRVLTLLIFALSTLFVSATQADYCGDVNTDGSINILDVIEIINYKYKGGPPPSPLVIADVDQSGSIDILDVIYIINFKYKGGPAPNCGIVGCAAIQGTCRSGFSGAGGTLYSPFNECLRDVDGDNGMYVEMIKGDLHVYHENAYYNCCLEYRVEFVIDGSNIIAYEYNDGDPCDCNCYFDLESVLEDLEPFEYTTYTVTLIGIDGSSVGTDTVSPEDFDYMTLEYDGYDLYVNHLDAYYNCCFEFQAVYSIMGNCINIFEFDIGSPCYCMCFFDLETVIEDVPAGQYFVTLFDIEGDTVGFESIEIAGSTGELTDYSSSGCLDYSRSDISYIYENGDLIMNDNNSYFNCSAEGNIIIEFEQVGNVLIFYEINTSNAPVDCMCYFEITATIADIPPGEYIAEIYAIDYSEGSTQLVDQRELVLE